MLRKKFAVFFGALFIAGSTFSAQQAICPDINDIKAEGLSMAEEIGANSYLLYNISAYNTSSTWGFIMAPLEGDAEDMAIEAGNEILNNMSAPGTPDQQYGSPMICTYDTGRKDIFAAAINDGAQISPMKLKQYFKKAH
jgi:hypothetical protein